ncbi:DgyrCDS9230 [Dimorphilus gyrociliatus]|uniref:DgyrCDS9230 n=1 Tax=Dimorphilus gyrociliatus TaxID=2664684 RepID=A0A7I8VYU8_9ANNE|nr:DgyrCDS9230 [Dimorphilus gyrociliatus]
MEASWVKGGETFGDGCYDWETYELLVSELLKVKDVSFPLFCLFHRHYQRGKEILNDLAKDYAVWSAKNHRTNKLKIQDLHLKISRAQADVLFMIRRRIRYAKKNMRMYETMYQSGFYTEFKRPEKKTSEDA